MKVLRVQFATKVVLIAESESVRITNPLQWLETISRSRFVNVVSCSYYLRVHFRVYHGDDLIGKKVFLPGVPARSISLLDSRVPRHCVAPATPVEHSCTTFAIRANFYPTECDGKRRNRKHHCASCRRSPMLPAEVGTH